MGYFSPENLTVAQVSNLVVLAWDSLEDVDTYIIHFRTPSTGRGFDPTNFETQLGHTNEPSFSYTPSEAGTVDYQVFGVWAVPGKPTAPLIPTLQSDSVSIEFKFGAPQVQAPFTGSTPLVVANTLLVHYTLGLPQLQDVEWSGSDYYTTGSNRASILWLGVEEVLYTDGSEVDSAIWEGSSLESVQSNPIGINITFGVASLQTVVSVGQYTSGSNFGTGTAPSGA